MRGLRSRREGSKGYRPRLEAMEPRRLLANLGAGASAVGSARPAFADVQTRASSLLATTMTILASANPSPGNQGVTYTVTVSGPPGSTIAPAGQVKLSVNGVTNPNDLYGGLTPSASDPGTSYTTIDVAPFTTDGTTQIMQPYFTGPGTFPVIASFVGDQNYLPSTSTTINQVVEQAPTTMFLSFTPSTVVAGQPLTLNAVAVVPNTDRGSYGPQFQGTISFFDGATPLGTLPVVPSTFGSSYAGLTGSATLTIPSLGAGPHSFTATYSGDSNYIGSTATVAGPTLIAASTSSVYLPVSTVALGQPITFLATVTGVPGGPVPTGQVLIGESSLLYANANSSIRTGINSNGQTTYTFLPTSPGPYTLGVDYLGDPNYQTSDASTILNVLIPVPISLTSSTNLTAPGQPVTLSATVTPPPTIDPFGGTVTFLDGTTPLGTSPLDANDQATLTTTSLGPGPHDLTALYNGNATFAATTSAAVPVTVQAGIIPIAGPPTVTGLQRQGVHHQPTTLVLSFSGPLDPTRAADIGNYVFTGPTGHHPIAITSAVYGPSANTVTLTMARRLDAHTSHRYRLIVNGTAPRGLIGADGEYLAGEGRSGTNYTAIFSGFVRPITPPTARTMALAGRHPGGLRHAAHARR